MPNTEDDKGNEALRARLEALSTAIGAQRKEPRVPDRPAPSGSGFAAGMGLAFRVVSELVAGVIVGGGIGWLLDRWLHTKPFLLILFLLLGLAGGIWNVIRATAMPQRGSGS